MFQKQACGDVSSSLSQVLGAQLGKAMDTISVSVDECDLELRFSVGKAKAIKNDEFFAFVNDRPADLKELSKVVKRAVADANAGNLGAMVAFITLPPERLDVNLDPSKMTVLIEGQERLFVELEGKLREHFGAAASSKENEAPEEVHEVGPRGDAPRVSQNPQTQRGESEKGAAGVLPFPEVGPHGDGGRVSPLQPKQPQYGKPEKCQSSDAARDQPTTPQQPEPRSPLLETNDAGFREVRSPGASHPEREASFEAPTIVDVTWSRRGLPDNIMKQAKINTWATGRAIPPVDSPEVAPVTLLGKRSRDRGIRGTYKRNAYLRNNACT